MTPADPTSRHLFRRYPALVGKLPWLPLADLPSPVEPLTKLGAAAGLRDLWVKRDDRNSPLYGGNKPRKFEFVFAEALALGRQEVVTLGGAGSNHAAAVCLYSQKLNLRATLAVGPQPVLSYVRRNILVDHACGAHFLVGENDASAFLKAAAHCLGPRLRGRTPPYFMYYGASSPTGNAGFVNAALELADQIKTGELPMPRRVFTATGSCGTHAGLLVGFRAAGLPIEVVGVSVVPKTLTNRYVVALHANRTVRFLRGLDPSFPALRVRPAEVRLLEDFVGGQYGRPTPEGKAAIRLMQETEGLTLDPTYTGKAFAGMLAFLRENKLAGEPALFWLTLNSRPLDRWIPSTVPDDLPPALRRYFTEPLYDPEL
jgi:D-cysteine desulfhydrase